MQQYLDNCIVIEVSFILVVLLRPHVQTKKRIFAPYLKKTKIMRVKLVSVVALFVLLVRGLFCS